jgi:hypothetical protein
MLSRIKTKLGMGKSGSNPKVDGPSASIATTVGVSSTNSIKVGPIPEALVVTPRKLGMPLADTPPSNSHGSKLPIVTVEPMAVDSENSPPKSPDDDEIVTRARVGRVSNRLSKRAEQMRQQINGDIPTGSSMLSHSLRTLESIASTGSQAEYFHPLQSIVIFDWDDTLCPSHWIRINRPKLQYFQPCPPDPKFKVPLEQLQDQVIRVLRFSSSIAKTVILTNAQVGWVPISCQNFMPRVWPVIQELKIDIIYARQSVENDIEQSRELDYNYNMNAPQLWKERAMKDNISRFYSQYLHQSWKNIVSIGDQTCEHNACRIVTMGRQIKKKCRAKTVKLVEEPSVENLIAENQVILQWLNGLVQYDGDLEVDLSNDDDVLFDLHSVLTKK